MDGLCYEGSKKLLASWGTTIPNRGGGSISQISNEPWVNASPERKRERDCAPTTLAGRWAFEVLRPSGEKVKNLRPTTANTLCHGEKGLGGTLRDAKALSWDARKILAAAGNKKPSGEG